jgi:hypothetical protein
MKLFCQGFTAGMSEIRDKAKTAPAKSRTFRDTGFPVSGKKFRLVLFKPPVRNEAEQNSSGTFLNLSTVR